MIQEKNLTKDVCPKMAIKLEGRHKKLGLVELQGKHINFCFDLGFFLNLGGVTNI